MHISTDMNFAIGPPKTHTVKWDRFNYTHISPLLQLSAEDCPQPVIVRRNAHKAMLVSKPSDRVDEIRMIENYSPVGPPRPTHISALEPSPIRMTDVVKIRIIVDMNTSTRGVEGRTDNAASLTRPQIMDRLIRMVAKYKYIVHCGPFELTSLMGISVFVLVDISMHPSPHHAPMLEKEVLEALGWDDLPEESSIKTRYERTYSEYSVRKNTGGEDTMFVCLQVPDPLVPWNNGQLERYW